jgi:hypothetical protein
VTVADLQRELAQYPAEAEVVIRHYDGEYCTEDFTPPSICVRQLIKPPKQDDWCPQDRRYKAHRAATVVGVVVME